MLSGRTVGSVPYDDDLVNRIRELIAQEGGIREQAMFGGLSFLVDGHLAIAVSGRGGVLVRVGTPDAARLSASTKAEPAVMGARTMHGWLRVGADDVRTKRQLEPWVRRGVGFARTLAPKNRPTH